MLKDGLFKNYNVKFLTTRCCGPLKREEVLINSINKNREVAGLLNLVEGDWWAQGRSRYTPRFIVGILCLTKTLLINQINQPDYITCCKEGGWFRKGILKGVIPSREFRNAIEKLPLTTTAKEVCDCFKNSSFNFYNETTKKYNLRQIYIGRDKLYRILRVFEEAGVEKVGSAEIINNAIKEIDEVLGNMVDDKDRFWCYGPYCSDITCYDLFNDAFNREKVIKGVVEGDAMEDNTQTLTINRPKQQENKLLTVGNKKAYTVGNGDYKHRNGVIKDGCVIKEEKAEMADNVYPIEDKNILADLEDLLNNVIDNPDTVDKIVNYLAYMAPAAHFISEMVGCGEIYNEESLLKYLEYAYTLSIGGDSTVPRYYKDRIIKYLRVAPQKPVFGKEYGLKQFEHSFCAALYNIKVTLNKAKEEEQEEEKEEVITHDAVQEHAEEDCEEYPADLEELQKLLEERRKKEAELDAEIKQAEEEARRKELVEQLLAADNRIKEKEERLAQLRKK